MIIFLPSVLTLLMVVSAIWSFKKGNYGYGNLLSALAAAPLGVLIVNISDASIDLSDVVYWIILLISLSFFIISLFFYIYKYPILNRIKYLGIYKIWDNREIFRENNYDYPSYCRFLIQSAKPGSIIRLLSTAGDGISLVSGEMDTAFKIPFKRGCRIQVVLVNPTSDRVAIKQQAEDDSQLYGAKREEGYLKKKIINKIKLIEEWRKEMENDPEIKLFSDAFQIKCVDDIPVTNLIDNGDVALFSLQVLNKKGKDSPIFLVRRTGKIYKFLQEYFDYLFNSWSISGSEVIANYKE